MIVDCRIQNNRGRARRKDQTPDRRSAAFTFCRRGIWLFPNINMYVRNQAFVQVQQCFVVLKLALCPSLTVHIVGLWQTKKVVKYANISTHG